MKRIILTLGLLFGLLIAGSVSAEKAYRCYYQIGILRGYSTIESATSTNFVTIKKYDNFSVYIPNEMTMLSYPVPTECPHLISFNEQPATTTIEIKQPEKCLDDSCQHSIVNNDYCTKQFGNNAQYNDTSKGCTCKPGYTLKADLGATTCRPAPITSKAITPQVVGSSSVTPAPMVREQILAKIQQILTLINVLKEKLAAMTGK